MVNPADTLSIMRDVVHGVKTYVPVQCTVSTHTLEMTPFAEPLGWTVLASTPKDQHTRSTKGMQNNQRLTPHCLQTELKIILVLGTKHVIHSLDTKLNQLNAAASRFT